MERLFQQYGPVKNCEIKRDARGLSIGWGYVHFYSAADASKALKEITDQRERGLTTLYVNPFRYKSEVAPQEESKARGYQGNNYDPNYRKPRRGGRW